MQRRTPNISRPEMVFWNFPVPLILATAVSGLALALGASHQDVNSGAFTLGAILAASLYGIFVREITHDEPVIGALAFLLGIELISNAIA